MSRSHRFCLSRNLPDINEIVDEIAAGFISFIPVSLCPPLDLMLSVSVSLKKQFRP